MVLSFDSPRRLIQGLIVADWASHVAIVVKNPPANAGDLRDLRGTWRVTVQEVSESQEWRDSACTHMWRGQSWGTAPKSFPPLSL